jgi:hypothetical protein
MYLADTNIFLEILLKHDKKEECKNFLVMNAGNIHLTDFSLHSIGVICFRHGKEKLFQKFLKDIPPFVDVITYLSINITKSSRIERSIIWISMIRINILQPAIMI